MFVWKTENSNSVRRMSNINENFFAMLQANPEKMAKMSAIKEFDESKFVWFCVCGNDNLMCGWRMGIV